MQNKQNPLLLLLNNNGFFILIVFMFSFLEEDKMKVNQMVLNNNEITSLYMAEVARQELVDVGVVTNNFDFACLAEVSIP